MIPVQSVEQMRAADEEAIDRFSVSTTTLVEIVGREVARAVLEQFSCSHVVVLVGSGNNGADALVAARTLLFLNFSVHVLVCKKPKKSEVWNTRLSAYEESGGRCSSLSQDIGGQYQEILKDCVYGSTVVLDGVFGTGFSGDVPSNIEELFSHVAESRDQGQLVVCSIDIPSGQEGNGLIKPQGLFADSTLVIQSLKPVHTAPGSDKVCGDMLCLDVGIHGKELNSLAFLVEFSDVQPIAKRTFSLERSSHKGSRPHVLIIGGLKSMEGAVEHAARGALRSGAGLVSTLSENVHAPKDYLAEVMRHVLDASDIKQQLATLLERVDVVVIGPGLGQVSLSLEIFDTVLSLINDTHTCIIDADALNLLAQHPEMFARVPEGAYLTPHPKEASRLFDTNDVELVFSKRFSLLSDFAHRHKVHCILKGAWSLIAGYENDILVTNPHRCPSLGVGGSGDVFAGILAVTAGMCPAGMSKRGHEALLLASYIHGELGTLLSSETATPFGHLPSEMCDRIPEVISYLCDTEAHEVDLSSSVFEKWI